MKTIVWFVSSIDVSSHGLYVDTSCVFGLTVSHHNVKRAHRQRCVSCYLFTMGSAEQRRARDADPSHDVHVQDPLFERRTCSGVSSSTHVLPLKRNSKKPSSATHSESQFEEQRSRSQPSECDHLSETASPAVSCMKQSDSFADLRTPLSPKAKVSRFTCEVLLVARLAITLWSYLGLGKVFL